MKPTESEEYFSNAFSLRQVKLQEKHGVVAQVIPEAEYDIAKHLEFIVSFVRDLLNETEPFGPKSPSNSTIGKQRSYLRLERALRVPPEEWQLHFDNHVFHPYVKIFVWVADRHHLYDWVWGLSYSGKERSDLLAGCRAMLEDLRASVNSAQVKTWVKTHKDEVRRNIKEVKEYVKALFLKHRRLLVIRIDFEFKKGEKAARCWDTAKKAREEITHYLKDKLPRVIRTKRQRETGRKPATVGYVLYAEYTRLTGWHFHCTLFMDGNQSCRGKKIGLTGKRYWINEVTGGAGRGFVCNLKKYATQAVGMMHVGKTGQMEAAINIATLYSCKGDEIARALVPKGDRLLTKGEYPN